MPHSKYTLTDRLVWNKTSLSFELKSKVYYKKGKQKSQIDVVKRTIDKVYLRNMCKYMITPWLFIHPSETYVKHIYYSSEPYGVDKLWQPQHTNAPELYGKTKQSIEKIKSLIMEHEPQFIYTFNAYIDNMSCISYYNYPYLKHIFDIYSMWKKHTYETEMLVKLGCIYLATKKGAYRLSKKNKQELYKWLLKNKDKRMYFLSLQDIQEKMLGIQDTKLYRQCHRQKAIYEYLLKQQNNTDYQYYKDYIEMAKDLNKDLSDNYWAFPKDLVAQHNKLVNERRAIYEAHQRQEREEMNNVLKTIPQCKDTINGFSLYLANDMSDIENQAEKLDQCLISCRFYEKVAKKSSLLIFMKQDNKPIGTCEIGYDKVINQCYGDEHDRDNCKLTNEQMEIMNSYIAKLKINNATKEIKYA